MSSRPEWRDLKEDFSITFHFTRNDNKIINVIPAKAGVLKNNQVSEVTRRHNIKNDRLK